MKYYYATFKTAENVAQSISAFHRLRKSTQEIPLLNQSLMLRIKNVLSYNANINDYIFYEVECDNKFNYISSNKIDDSVIKKLVMLL